MPKTQLRVSRAERAQRALEELLRTKPVTHHPNACVSCQRVVLARPGRRCKACIAYASAVGADKLKIDGKTTKIGLEASGSGVSVESTTRWDKKRDGGRTWDRPPIYDASMVVANASGSYDPADNVYRISDPITERCHELALLGLKNTAIGRILGIDRTSVRDRLAHRNGEPLPPYPDHNGIPCFNCKTLRSDCGWGISGETKPCCGSCDHPELVHCSETTCGYEWGAPQNEAEREWWNSWPGKTRRMREPWDTPCCAKPEHASRLMYKPITPPINPKRR